MSEHKTVFYVNPQSYHSLADYDFRLIQSFLGHCNFKTIYYCNELFDKDVARIDGLVMKKIFKYSRKKFKLQKFLSYVASIIRFTCDVSGIKPSLVHFQWLKSPIFDFLMLVFITYVVKVPIVLTAHNFPMRSEHRGKIARYFERKAYHLCNTIVVHTADAKKLIQSNPAFVSSNVVVQPHGLLKFSSENAAIENSIKHFFCGHFCIKAAFVGSGGYYKGLDILLEAWRNAGLENVGLIAAGRLGLGCADVEKVSKFNNSLILDRELTTAEVAYIYSHCDIVILPHRDVSQSGVLMSSLGHRVPVVVSPLSEFVAAVSLSDCGWVFDGTSESLSNLLKVFSASPDMVFGKRRSCDWNSLEQKYSWNSAGFIISSTYQRIVYGNEENRN